jgi:hypothetical protein
MRYAWQAVSVIALLVLLAGCSTSKDAVETGARSSSSRPVARPSSRSTAVGARHGRGGGGPEPRRPAKTLALTDYRARSSC